MRLLFALLLFALTAHVLAQTSATQISSGNFHTCAVTNTGTVRCWGEGALGRLGYGNQNDIG
ncbi:MAG: RCC1 domain-containing protein, partial [Bacteroidota bacterium]